MTPTRFIALGLALYGPSWKAPLAHVLHVTPRQISHYAAGTRPIPQAQWVELKKVLIAHGGELKRLAGEIAV